MATPKQEKIFIGVSWPYANGPLHLGHLAGQNVVCDVFARYHRLKGNKVMMVSGSDSHGAPVVFKAEEEGLTPEEMFQSAHKDILKVFDELRLVYENYTHTHTENHKIVSQNLFKVLEAQGYLKTQKSKQYYDTEVERFLPDRYVRGTCPECGNKKARGDECPECGKYLEPEQLIDPYSTLSDSKPELRETEQYYLDLKSLAPEIQDFIEKRGDIWRTWVREFALGWIRQGLEPRPITRDMDYGIPVPIEGWDGKVLYVWFEAVIGYLSAAIEWADKQGTPSAWEDFWKDPEAKHYYFIAGGNAPFHTIIWPAELLGYNEKYDSNERYEMYKLPGETLQKPLQLPYNVPANNMLFYKGKKMSKGDSTGLTIESLLEDYGPDIMRFFFTRFAPEKQDREYTMDDFYAVNNNDLVGNLGNFINRTLSFGYKNFDGTVPNAELAPEVLAATEKAYKQVGKYIEECKFNAATKALLAYGDFANKYFNDKAPWLAIKDNPDDASITIFNSIQIVNNLVTLLKPFTPHAADRLAATLGHEVSDPNYELEKDGRVTTYEDLWTPTYIESGTKFAKPELLYRKIEAAT